MRMEDDLAKQFKERFVEDEGETLPSAKPSGGEPPVDYEAQEREAEDYGGDSDT